VLSSHSFSEFWVIDHSTTTAEAAGHTVGNSGMGGDILYRWGNPLTYDAGSTSDQQFFKQHDAQWIDVITGTENIDTESSWGFDSTSSERNGTTASGFCGITTRDNSESCP